MTIDGHPLRWQMIQAILRLVWSYLPILNLPRSIQVVNRPCGGFPFVYFLRSDIEERLMASLVEEICMGRTAILPCATMAESDQKDLKTFISSPTLPRGKVKAIDKLFKPNPHLLNVVYLLRGLIVHRVLLTSLKKRWNVQYGLHPLRDPIAVPYLAKGVPSPSAEFGHPDVCLILTCLSFYYQGLSVPQFKQAFEQLLKHNEPSIEFEKWATEALPEGLRDYTAINVEDRAQLHELHAHIRYDFREPNMFLANHIYARYNHFAIDFYMNVFVFPRHAKQFSMKLQASAWDLVLYDPVSPGDCRTTGFSGTNDSRHQLPMTIQQTDLPKTKHTNAEVLAYLLEPRNRGYAHTVDASGKRWTETGLLENLKRLGIRVLIDAGAQILEHDNVSLAKAWLTVDFEAEAVVYFKDDHKPWVMYRQGRTIPLVASTFADDLGPLCLVYLDESHCRGTDLKLSPYAKAALTLGPNVTKDALTQAAMRLRLLGQTQSVRFFAPPEVHNTILDICKMPSHLRPNSSHVIRWLLAQSCNAIEALEPLHIAQGENYLQRIQAKLDNPNFLDIHSRQNSKYLSVLRSQETTTLKELYKPKDLKHSHGLERSVARNLQPFARKLVERRKNFQDRGIALHASALEEVEQEREVENEVENVREVQIPVHFLPYKPGKLHDDIREFAHSGKLLIRSEAYGSMLSFLRQTALAKSRAIFSESPTTTARLFVSTQFHKTVKLTEPNDNFLRKPQWILWSCKTKCALVVSPEEADALIPILRGCISEVHLIVYAAPVTRKMLHFNNLTYYAIPPLPASFEAPDWLKIELGIFSGRLYFDWNEYAAILEYVNSSNPIFAKNPLTYCESS